MPRALIRMMAALGVSAGSRMHETRQMLTGCLTLLGVAQMDVFV